MSTHRNFWIPSGNLTPAQAMALAVPVQTKPSQQDYPELLERKLREVINLDPEQAAEAMVMSQEQAPDQFLIAQSQPQSQWATALTNSDSVSSLWSRIDWSQPGSLKRLPPQSLLEILEQMP